MCKYLKLYSPIYRLAYIYIYTNTYICIDSFIDWLTVFFWLNSELPLIVPSIGSFAVSLYSPLQCIHWKTKSFTLYNSWQLGFCCHLECFSVLYISCKLLTRSSGSVWFRHDTHHSCLQEHFVDSPVVCFCWETSLLVASFCAVLIDIACYLDSCPNSFIPS